jgi:hypothetical protein
MDDVAKIERDAVLEAITAAVKQAVTDLGMNAVRALSMFPSSKSKGNNMTDDTQSAVPEARHGCEELTLAENLIEFIDDTDWELSAFVRENANAILKALRQPTQSDPEAMRYSFDGFGYKYIDSGSGSDWRTRHPDAEPLYLSQPTQSNLHKTQSAAEQSFAENANKSTGQERQTTQSDALKIPTAALDALRNDQKQIDEDGVMVVVSRQALHEVLAALVKETHLS